MEREIERSEVEAALAARRELGTEYDDAFVEQFAERIEQVVQARVRAEVAPVEHDDGPSHRQWILGLTSLGTGIPITGIAAADHRGVAGVVVAWLGIVGVNVAHALSNRRRPR